MAIVRLYDGSDGQSHFEEITPRFEPRGDQSEIPELIPGTGILMRRFETKRETLASRTGPICRVHRVGGRGYRDR